MSDSKRPRGRPVEYPMPPRIDASPEEIAQVILSAPPPDEWDYERARDDQIAEKRGKYSAK